MFQNYFKTALRNISANKLFATLNIAGLAIGLGVGIVLFAFISYQLSFDKIYKNGKNIYRVNMETTAEYHYEKWAELPNAVGPALKQSIAQVRLQTRLIKDDFGAPASLKTGDKNFVEKGLYLADASMFKIFDFDFLQGNANNVFAQPHSIVLSEAAKERLFGDGPALGKIIYVNNRDTLQVTGIYKNLPRNSTIDCDMIYNIMDSWMGKNVSWSNASFETYCLLPPKANILAVQKQATALIDKNVDKQDQYYTKFLFQPLSKIYLYSSDLRPGYSSRSGNISNVKILLFLSLLILFIACINYMNLATARLQKRSKEVGVNKVLGANIPQMLTLFYTETGVLSLMAIVAGYILAILIVPVFRQVSGFELSTSVLYSTPVLFSLLVVWLAVTLVAGSYPAISLSGISPLVLMNQSKQKHSLADMIRKVLVVFQFASSIVLIIAVIIIVRQMNFIRSRNLGYDPDGVAALSIKSARDTQQLRRAIADVKNLPGVQSASATQSIPGDVESGRSVRKLSTDKQGMPVKTCHTDGAIVETLGLELLAGTTLPQTISKGDTTCYTLINEEVAKYLGFTTPQDAIGKNIRTEMADKSVVTGVVKNFNFRSLKDQVGGYVYYEMNRAPEGLRTLLVRYNTQDLPHLMDQLQKAFKNDLPNTAFDYQFLDKHVEHLYTSEEHTASTATVFSILAIFIACLGLFGLAAFTAEKRTKEIGIRKVLGASVPGITKLLAKDFLKLVILSIIIASPVAWWLMNRWLLDFAYRIHIDWWVFAVAGLMAILIAVITISFQAIKAAVANPVKSLRTE